MTDRRHDSFLQDDRAVSFNVGYTITVGITAILIIGLISGVGVVIDGQQNRAISHQVDVIGDQVASGVMATDRLGGVGEGANASITRELPSDVVGTPYSVRLVDQGDGGAVVVEAVNGEYEETVPVNIEGDIQETAVPGGVTVEIVHEIDRSTGERTVRIQPENEPPTGADTADDSYYAVTINSVTPNPADGGDTVTVDATITNTGAEAGDQDVSLSIVNVGQVDSESVSLAPGESTTVPFEWDSAQRTNNLYETAEVTTDDAMSIATFGVSADDPAVEVHDFEVGDKTDAETFSVDVPVEELNNVEADDVDVELTVTAPDGSTVYNDDIELDDLQGETRTVTFGEGDSSELGPFPSDSDDYTVEATATLDDGSADSSSTTFNVDPDVEPANFEVTITDVPTSVPSDEDYVVEADIENTGEETSTQTIDLTVDGVGTVDQTTVTNLAGGESESVTFTWSSDDTSPGEFTSTVESDDDAETNDFTVTATGVRLTDVEIDDDSQSPPPWDIPEIEYHVDYTVTGDTSDYDHVQVSLRNPGAVWNRDQTESTAISDTLTVQSGHGYGDDVEVVVRVYDSDGEVVSERIVVDDTADGVDP